MMSPLISTIVGSSPSYRDYFRVKESDDGKILSSKSNVHTENVSVISSNIIGNSYGPTAFKDEPTRPSNESTDE